MKPSMILLVLILAWGPRLAAQSGGFRGDRCEAAVPGKVVIYGDVEKRLELSGRELQELERSRVDGQFHDGRPARFEGVPLWTILAMAGVPAQLKSGDLARFAVVEAADGYRVLFALAELDPRIKAVTPILADRQDGEPLREGFGPFQMIVPGELRQARWVRQVECIKLERWKP